MDGCVDGEMGGLMGTDGWMDGILGGWMESWVGGSMESWVGGWMNGWMGKRMNGWMSRWADEYMERCGILFSNRLKSFIFFKLEIERIS